MTATKQKKNFNGHSRQPLDMDVSNASEFWTSNSPLFKPSTSDTNTSILSPQSILDRWQRP